MSVQQNYGAPDRHWCPIGAQRRDCVRQVGMSNSALLSLWKSCKVMSGLCWHDEVFPGFSVLLWCWVIIVPLCAKPALCCQFWHNLGNDLHLGCIPLTAWEQNPWSFCFEGCLTTLIVSVCKCVCALCSGHFYLRYARGKLLDLTVHWSPPYLTLSTSVASECVHSRPHHPKPNGF